MHSRFFRRFVKSRAALALPVTFLILLVSTLAIITVTYAFSIENIKNQTATLKASIARQSFLSLNNVILSTLGQPGSSNTIDMSDTGGKTNVEPTSNNLTISVTDNSSIEQTIFDSPVGQVTYELPASGSIDTGFYLAGDSDAITNRSGSSLSQLYITTGSTGPQIQLQYRPTVTYATAGLQNGQAINEIRIYIVNLNSSAPIALQGDLPLQISCTNTQLTTHTYQVSYQTENLVITSQLNGSSGNVSIPISSTSKGSITYVETVISNVSIQRWIR